MKIRKIKILKLFNIENNNFDITLYPDDNITLLYAFNGEGKTTIIKIVYAALVGDLKTLRMLPFHSAEIEFINNYSLLIEKESGYDPEKDYEFTTNSGKRHVICTGGMSYYAEFNKDHPIKITEKIENKTVIEHIFKTGKSKTLGENGKIKLPYEYLTDEASQELLALREKLKTFVDIRCIFANRSFNRTEGMPEEILIEGNKIELKYYRDNLESLQKLKLLHKKIEIYLNGTQEDDFSYYVHIPNPIEEISKKLIEKNNKFNERNNNNQTNEAKDFYNRIKLFENTINSDFKLRNKDIIFDSTIGLKIIQKDGISTSNSFNRLSSGENNLICLFAEIILTCESNSVVFIDEPEVSLHVDWQNKIVTSLYEICKQYDIQVIIMTHSPDIIGEFAGLSNALKASQEI